MMVPSASPIVSATPFRVPSRSGAPARHAAPRHISRPPRMRNAPRGVAKRASQKSPATPHETRPKTFPSENSVTIVASDALFACTASSAATANEPAWFTQSRAVPSVSVRCA